MVEFPKHIFKEYDIRGLFEEDFSEDLIKKLGYFIGLEIKKFEDKVCIGYDCRIHSPQCFDCLVSGLNHAGVLVISLGYVPTPVCYYSGYFDKIGCKSNVMITASHNAKEYNGFKITIDNKSFFGEDILRLMNLIINCDLEIPDSRIFSSFDIVTPYVDMIVDKFSHLKGFDKRFIFDCGNGMAGPVIEKILDKLNMSYELMFSNSDGNFPNHPADPSIRENLNDLIFELNKENVNLGFAFDGDTDRVFASLKSDWIMPDELGVIISRNLKNPKVLGDPRCSKVMYDEINKIGSSMISKVGHSNIKKMIRDQGDVTFAIELTGHIFFNDKYFGFDDAIYSALRVIELCYYGVDFEKEITDLPKYFSSPEIRKQVDNSKKFEIVSEFVSRVKNMGAELGFENYNDIDGVRVEFSDGWGLVRASNTSAVLSMRFEGITKDSLNNIRDKLETILEQVISEI